MPFLSPSYFKSDECLRELALFRELEQRRGRRDLILPIYYLLDRRFDANTASAPTDLRGTFAFLKERQYVDWRPLRLSELSSAEARRAVAGIAVQLRDAIELRVGAGTPHVSATGSQELIVNTDDSGHFKTIKEALAAARGGDNIILVSSEYVEDSIRVDKPVNISARTTGGQPRISGSGDCVFEFAAPSGSLKGVTVDYHGEAKAAVVSRGPKLLIENCWLKGGKAPCLVIADGSSPNVRHSQLTDGTYGIVANGKTDALIEDCRIERQLYAIADCQCQGTPMFRNNLFRNARGGVWARFESEPQLINNDVDGSVTQ